MYGFCVVTILLVANRLIADTLLTDEQRNATHLSIAKKLLAAARSPPSDNELFAIVKQFNKADSSLPASSHRMVVELNVAALKAACTGASYDTAFVRLWWIIAVVSVA